MRKQHHGIHTRPHLSRQVIQSEEANIINLSILLLCQFAPFAAMTGYDEAIKKSQQENENLYETKEEEEWE
jgi:hypothetical protein